MKDDDLYQSILAKLSIMSPFFAKAMLDKCISDLGKTSETVSAIELLDIVKNKLNPKLSKGKTRTNSILLEGAGIITLNRGNEIIYTNSFAKKIIYQIKEILPEIESDFVLLSNLGFCKIVQEVRNIDIREIYLEPFRKSYNISIAPIFDKDNIITGSMTIIQDNTLHSAIEKEVLHQNKKLLEEIENRKKAQKELKEKQDVLVNTSKLAALGEMAGGIAHEINNPLTIISMSVQSILKMKEKGLLQPSMLDQMLKKILSTTERISNIVKGMRVISRNSEGESFGKDTLRNILGDVIALTSEKFKDHQVDLSLNESPALDDKIDCKPVQLSQVFLNLVNNSFDAIESLDVKWVKFTICDLKEQIEIRVSDSGSGISSEVSKKILQPFFTTKEIGKGTGLGLSLSHSIIKHHGGSLHYDQTCENTTFVIHLPKEKVKTTKNKNLGKKL
ncbi:MAG: GHKL domain-containing protein [Bacteriovoracaceae bacterium]|jgi:signal transduction histidine kinase|nr:GHKL domain-containing protein [Bacteriovoracaceae bacterium]